VSSWELLYLGAHALGWPEEAELDTMKPGSATQPIV